MKLVVWVTTLALTSSEANAAPIELSCRGILHQYVPTVADGSISPTAARVDLDKGRISTPLGRFHITKVDDSDVFFEGASSGYLVAGSLDRTSGEMNMRWITEEEQAKLDRGGKARLGMSAELKCTVATRLF